MGQMYYKDSSGNLIPLGSTTTSPIQEGLNPSTGANGTFFYDTDATSPSTPMMLLSSTTDNAIARFDGTGGLIQNSGVTISDTNVVAAPTLQLNGSTSGTVQLVAPAVAGTVTQTMGVGYQYVQTLYYTTVGTATFTKATYPWLRAIRVKCVGGGGGGGGSGTDGRGGSGGGGGGCTEKFITDISGLASSITVTVGDGGNGGTAGNNNGSAGSNSSFATSTSIIGNGGGAGQHPAQDFPYGGDGGSGSGGDVTFAGGGGGSAQGSGNPQAAGMGGSSILGGGSKGAARQNGLESTGTAGNGYGGGGGGGARFNTNNVAGGKGAQGIVIVELYA